MKRLFLSLFAVFLAFALPLQDAQAKRFGGGNLDDIREFTSPEVFAEIRLQLEDRGNVDQQTEVLNLDAQVLEALEEGNRHLVSVRFSGLIREKQDAPATDFNEIWHLTRPAQGKQGWVVAGIQQAR